jgi:hypothetical protein
MLRKLMQLGVATALLLGFVAVNASGVTSAHPVSIDGTGAGGGTGGMGPRG